MQTLGAILREQRDALGVTLAEVEEVTRIRQKYLAALEADEWHLLPGEVVGRGFLRNYALFLGLDPEELMERRRAMLDPELLQALADTSAGTTLPPVREVDYRPKDVDLEETPITAHLADLAEASRSWVGPLLTIALIALVLFGVWWGFRQIGDNVAATVQSIQTRIARASQASQVTPIAQAEPPVQPADTNSGTTDGGGTGNSDGSSNQESAGANPVVVISPTDTPTPTPIPPTATDTPTPLPPTATDTPTPFPTPTDTPAPPPTPTPEPVVVEPTAAPPPPEPVVVAPVCPDPRAVITSPGVNQVVSGNVPILGRAVHEQFNFYKLEFAPGADAQNGYVYFDGGQSPVENGQLGTFASGAVANGTYTVQLTVVDQTGNYPPPCRVTIVVQN